MLLSDEEHFNIILSCIRDYSNDTDMAILIVEKLVSEIINSVDVNFTTQDVFDEIIEVFDFYNDFISTKKIDIKPIPDGMKDLVEVYINEVVNNVSKT